MLLTSALKGMEKHKEALLNEALLESSITPNPSTISQYTHCLAQYISAAEDRLAELEYDLELNESKSFLEHVKNGKSANAAKELTKREFVKERATITKTSRLVSSGWRLVSESQSRVRHLIAEANNQI